MNQYTVLLSLYFLLLSAEGEGVGGSTPSILGPDKKRVMGSSDKDIEGLTNSPSVEYAPESRMFC